MDIKLLITTLVENADKKIINTTVIILCIIIIVTVLLLCYFFVKKVLKTTCKDEDFYNLKKKIDDLQNEQKALTDSCNKTKNTLNFLYQLYFSILTLINSYSYNIIKKEEAYYRANELIKTIVYIIPTSFISSAGDVQRVFVWTPTKDSLTLENTYSSTGSLQQNLGMYTSFAGRVYITGEEKFTPNVQTEKEFERRSRSKGNYNSLMAVPIKLDGKTLGVLTIDSKKENAFNEEDMHNINFFAILISTCFMMFAICGEEDQL